MFLLVYEDSDINTTHIFAMSLQDHATQMFLVSYVDSYNNTTHIFAM